MLIECPHCARTYDVAGTAIGPAGRKMRCAGCREVWQVAAAAPETGEGIRDSGTEFHSQGHCGPEISAQATSERSSTPGYDELYGAEPAAPGPVAARWRLPRPPLALLAGMAALAGTMGLVAARQTLVRHMPAAAPLYAAIGLPVNLRGLELRHVTSALAGEGAQRVLAIEGEITNVSRGEAPVPLLQISLRGGDGRAIYRWTTPAPKTTLAFGEMTQFRARLAAPPENARDISVQFAPAGVAIREAKK